MAEQTFRPPTHIFAIWNKVRGVLVYEQLDPGKMVPLIFEKEVAAENFRDRQPNREELDVIYFTSNHRFG